MVAWSDGTQGPSHFGTGPVRRIHNGPGWSSSLILVREGHARVGPGPDHGTI